MDPIYFMAAPAAKNGAFPAPLENEHESESGYLTVIVSRSILEG
jgi:hypothetical protein